MSGPIPTTESDYRGYIIEYGSYPAQKPGDWFGIFRVHKDGLKVYGADIVNPADTSALAEANAREKAIEYVDEILDTRSKEDH